MVRLLKKTPVYDQVEITIPAGRSVHVMSGDVVESAKGKLILRLRQNDSLLVAGRTVLWWNKAESCFVRQ